MLVSDMALTKKLKLWVIQHTLFTVLVLFNPFKVVSQILIDNQATTQTKNLYKNLFKNREKAVLFGHQDDLTSGINWKNNSDSSDIKNLIGIYPAVFGWDIGKIELNNQFNFEGVSLQDIANNIKFVYRLGGINTLSWHCYNPVNPSESAKSKTDSTIKKLFSDSKTLERYNLWLDKVATFLTGLKGNNGESIPIILRLFHEHTGDWFWWGKSHCTPDEYIKLWRYTVEYLKNTKKVHNLIYAYCTDKFLSKEQFLDRYPGDDYVDIIGSDIYDKIEYHTKFVDTAPKMVAMLREIGTQKNKPFAIMETGFQQMPMEDWWTQTLYPVLQNSGLSYVLVWRNTNLNSYWGVFKGQKSEVDFKRFSKYKHIYFLPRISSKNFYRK